MDDGREKKRKRTTVTRACLACRKAHAKCSEPLHNMPCKRCVSKGIKCVYPEEVRLRNEMLMQQHQHQHQATHQINQFRPSANSNPQQWNPQYQQQQQQYANPSFNNPNANMFQQQPPQKNISPNYSSSFSMFPPSVQKPVQSGQFSQQSNTNTAQQSEENNALLKQQKDMIDALSKTVQQQAQMLQKMMHQMSLTPPPTSKTFTNPFVEYFDSEHIGVAMWKFVNQHERVLVCANEAFARMTGLSLVKLSYMKLNMNDMPAFLLGEERNDPEKMRNFLDVQKPAMELGKKYNSFIEESVQKLKTCTGTQVSGKYAFHIDLTQQNNILFAKYQPTDVYTDAISYNGVRMEKTYELRDLSKFSARDVQQRMEKYLTAVKTALYPNDTRDLSAFQDSPEQQRVFERRVAEDLQKQRSNSDKSSASSPDSQTTRSPTPEDWNSDEVQHRATLEYQMSQFQKHHDAVLHQQQQHMKMLHQEQLERLQQEERRLQQQKEMLMRQAPEQGGQYPKQEQKLTPTEHSQGRVISVPSPQESKERDPHPVLQTPDTTGWDNDEFFGTDSSSFFR